MRGAAFAVLAALTLTVHAQPPRTVTGRVVSDATGDPLPNARVTLRTGALGAPVVLTDADERFALSGSADRVVLGVSKSGYGPREVAATAGAPIDVRLQRGAAISGRVIDQYGDAVVFARVTAETRPATAASTVIATTDTDDRGEYRLSSLPAARVSVAVTAAGGTFVEVIGGNQIAVRPTIQKTYYPRAPAIADAEVFDLRGGDEHADIDFVTAARDLELPPLAIARRLQSAADPPATAATGVIRGRVVTTDGRAAGNAQLRLTAPFDVTKSRVGRADADGRYEFSGLVAGNYGLVAVKASYSAAPPPGAPAADIAPTLERIVELRDGETRERVDVALARWGSLTGRILDEYGDPLQGVSVQALRVGYDAGRRRLVPADASARLTDDLGRYRLFALPPGQYVIAAAVGSVSGADVPGYARSYFPGAISPSQAQFVSVRVAQDVAGVDFALTRARTGRIAGKVIDAAGQPTTAGSFVLRPSIRSAAVTSETIGARILPDGTFEFPNVPPGQYVMQAARGRSRPWIEGEFGAMPVAVDGTDVTGLVFQTSSGSSITGRIAFDTLDRTKTPSPGAIEIAPVPSDADLAPAHDWARANIHADWTFEMGGINGPRRLQVLSAPAGWALKEIRAHGVDVSDRPLPFGRSTQSLDDVEIVMTDRVNQLTGTVNDDRARPVPGSLVIVFSTDRDRWYPFSRFLRKATAGNDGAFSLIGLPFGSYYAVAVARLPTDDPEEWQEPAWLESLRFSATTITLGDGEKQTLNLRVLAGR